MRWQYGIAVWFAVYLAKLFHVVAEHDDARRGGEGQEEARTERKVVSDPMQECFQQYAGLLFALFS